MTVCLQSVYDYLFRPESKHLKNLCSQHKDLTLSSVRFYASVRLVIIHCHPLAYKPLLHIGLKLNVKKKGAISAYLQTDEPFNKHQAPATVGLNA